VENIACPTQQQGSRGQRRIQSQRYRHVGPTFPVDRALSFFSAASCFLPLVLALFLVLFLLLLLFLLVLFLLVLFLLLLLLLLLLLRPFH